MREILFKAKRTDNGEWVEGYYFHTEGMAEGHKDYIIPKEDWFATNYGVQGGWVTHEKFIEIDINTLCQYTGLTDKNGNKIWENDIVQIDAYSYTECEGDACGQLVYSDVYASFGLLLKDRFVTICDLQGSYKTIYEVLGNVFDNPELLKEE